MVAIPEPSHSTPRAIFKLHEDRRERDLRPYLGASELGEPCLRRLWLRFRWAEVEQFEGRMLRLFETGELGETRLLAELEGCGMRVEGRQWEVEFAFGHGKGHLDAVVLGLVEAPKTWHVIDVKTAKASKFAEMKKKGVAAVYPKYRAQLIVYMGLTGLERAGFFLVNKDTDEIELERVQFDKAEFDQLMQRAENVIFAAEPPPKISDDPSWYECKFCPFHDQCHGTTAPLPGCRTCAHATIERDGGRWTCGLNGQNLDTDFQRLGCESHVYIPRLIENFAELESAEGDQVVWRNKITGRTFAQPEYRSREFRAAEDKRLLGEEGVDKFKGVFGPARIINTGPVKPSPMPRDPTFRDDLPWGNNGQDSIAGG